mmetsp:Transcript_44786/g.118785  ORF Transcript_44786/g.118785 Transcript_44786/m.118785 type:complete len:111 (+) Transcript_44786:286-618(+)
MCSIVFIRSLATLLSNAAVGSSNRKTGEFSRRARARATRCCWPPESFAPVSPHLLSSARNSASSMLDRGGVSCPVARVSAASPSSARSDRLNSAWRHALTMSVSLLPILP